MVYQIIQNSLFQNIIGFGSVALTATIVGLIIFGRLSARTILKLIGVGLVLFIACLVGMIVGSHQRDAQNDASFSKQLMDEYGVTSSRNLYAIQLDFARFDEARTVFTKDGKETPVYIKLVDKDEKHYEMAFTVLDDKLLFPKVDK